MVLPSLRFFDSGGFVGVPFLHSFFLRFKGGLKSGVSSGGTGYRISLWFALVGGFFDPRFLGFPLKRQGD